MDSGRGNTWTEGGGNKGREVRKEEAMEGRREGWKEGVRHGGEGGRGGKRVGDREEKKFKQFTSQLLPLRCKTEGLQHSCNIQSAEH